MVSQNSYTLFMFIAQSTITELEGLYVFLPAQSYLLEYFYILSLFTQSRAKITTSFTHFLCLSSAFFLDTQCCCWSYWSWRWWYFQVLKDPVNHFQPPDWLISCDYALLLVEQWHQQQGYRGTTVVPHNSDITFTPCVLCASLAGALVLGALLATTTITRKADGGLTEGGGLWSCVICYTWDLGSTQNHASTTKKHIFS